MKKIIIFIFLIFSFIQINAWRYSAQKNTYYYTIDLPDYPETWELVDNSKKNNVLFQNQSKAAFFEITVYDLNSADSNQHIFDFVIQRFKMNGDFYNTTFCQYEAIRGEYVLNFEGNDLKMDLVVFKDNYFFYALMGYAYKKHYENYKEELKKILNTCKIYYDNNVVYGNDDMAHKEAKSAKKNNLNKKIDNEPKNYDFYPFHVKWDKRKADFEFLMADLIASKKEIIEIGDYDSNGSWKGWAYFGIDTKNDLDHNFTFWKKFYQEMFNKNYYRVNDVVEYFEKISETDKLSSYELAKSVMQCIQAIPYERPKNLTKKDTVSNSLDYFTPNELADYKKGDCDTKSLFMVIVLRRLGFDALMYHSAHYGHAMVGININASGAYKT